MCTRYVLLEEHYRAVLARLGIAPPPDRLASRYNIAPGTTIPAIRLAAADSAREAVGLHWGLIPPWAKSPRDKLVNVRAETLAAKPYFQRALVQRRCAVPASGFYEWQTLAGAKQPWLFRWRDDAPFLLAGIWTAAHAADGSAVETCALITTTPNATLAPIHDRMPVLLSLDQAEAWLDPQAASPATLAPLLQPAPAGMMTAVTVSARMNNARVDDASCIAPVQVSGGESEPQLSLGL